MSELFYAQQREDEWIAKNLSLPESGVYVDLGCGHPFITSNTAFLRDRKWDGLAVDGNPAWSEYWAGIPAFCCSIVSSSPEVLFFEDSDVPERSRITASVGRRRCAETVEELLDRFEIAKIDFLSLDVEGKEFETLMSLDFDKHEPSIIVVEYNTADIGEDSRIKPFMLDEKQYWLRYQNPINLIFTRE